MTVNYKEMYLELFNRISSVVEDLTEIQQYTEKMYMEAEEENIKKPSE